MICANRRSKVIFGKPLAPYIGRLLFERGRRSVPSVLDRAFWMSLLVGMTAASGCLLYAVRAYSVRWASQTPSEPLAGWQHQRRHNTVVVETGEIIDRTPLSNGQGKPPLDSPNRQS